MSRDRIAGKDEPDDAWARRRTMIAEIRAEPPPRISLAEYEQILRDEIFFWGIREPGSGPPLRPADPRDRALDPRWADSELSPLELLQRRVDELEEVVLALLGQRGGGQVAA